MAIEMTDVDLEDPSIAFAKAMQVAAPDYGDELKRIKTALQAIEHKPALGLTAEALGAHIQGACLAGSADAVAALNSAATDYKTAQQREATLLENLESTSWMLHAFFAAFLLASGWGLGFMMSGNLAQPIPVPSLRPIATAADCKESGGNMGTDKETRSVCTLSVRP